MNKPTLPSSWTSHYSRQTSSKWPCFYDSNCNNLHNVDDGDEDNSPMEVYSNLPEKGQTVDSILYLPVI